MAATEKVCARPPTPKAAWVHIHAAGGENGSIMVGMFVCLCLASKKPSEREIFVPVGTDLAVKLLKQNRYLNSPFLENTMTLYKREDIKLGI
jgi:hypothetical protein